MKRSADHLNEEEDDFAWIPRFPSRPERQPPPSPLTPECLGKLDPWSPSDDQPEDILQFIRMRRRSMDLPTPNLAPSPTRPTTTVSLAADWPPKYQCNE